MDKNLENDIVRGEVRSRYAKIADTGSCCSGVTFGDGKKSCSSEVSVKLGYDANDLATVPDGEYMGLGCGNPHNIALLKTGETVLDLGSGGGLDCFLASKQVGDSGKVIGVDMTAEMISKARKNATKGDYQNTEFRLGEIEYLPVADNSVDVILSNCVITLSPDKPQVYSETFRVIRSGGRIAISDVVAIKPIPSKLKDDFEAFSGCVSGAIERNKIVEILKSIGFVDIEVNIKEESKAFINQWSPKSGVEAYVRSAEIKAFRP